MLCAQQLSAAWRLSLCAWASSMFMSKVWAASAWTIGSDVRQMLQAKRQHADDGGNLTWGGAIALAGLSSSYASDTRFASCLLPHGAAARRAAHSLPTFAPDASSWPAGNDRTGATSGYLGDSSTIICCQLSGDGTAESAAGSEAEGCIAEWQLTST